jgi:GT2 family glycosyltransferase
VSVWKQRLAKGVAGWRGLELRLAPGAGITADAKDAHTFHCEGAEPTFRLVPPDGAPLPGGWVRLAGTCERRGAELFATLVALGDDGSEQRFPVPMTRAGRIDQVLRLPDRVRELRWIALLGTGKVIQRGFRITALGEAERRARMAGWVAHDLWKFRGTDACATVGLRATRLARDLDGAYTASGRLRAHAPREPYAAVVERDDALGNAEEARLWQRLCDKGPRIAIAVRCDGKSLDDARSALRTLDAQRYTRWTLHPLVTETTREDVTAFFRAASLQDARVVVPSSAPTHGAALRRVIERADEALVLLLDAGAVTLAPIALTLLAAAHTGVPNAAFVTSDEDVLDADGKRSNPYRTPRWNRELFEAQLRCGSLAAFRLDALRPHAPLLETVNHADGFALVLALANGPAFEAHVIPWTLAHRSQPFVGTSDPARDEAIGILRAFHAASDGADVRPGLLAGTAHVRYPVPSASPRVTIIVPTRDGVAVLRTCIESLRAKTLYPNYEVLVVDNQSREPETLAYLAELERSGAARVLRHDAPFNYSAINNRAVRESLGELLAFLNDDIEVTDGTWLTEMVGHALRPAVGAVGAKLLYPDGFVQHAGVVIGIGGVADHVYRLYPADHPGDGGRAQVAQQYEAVTAACLVMRRDVFEQAGGFDEASLPVAFNDVDLCLKLRARGLEVVWTPHACLIHHESYSRGHDRATREKRRRSEAEMDHMRKRWGTATYEDPFSSAERRPWLRR